MKLVTFGYETKTIFSLENNHLYSNNDHALNSIYCLSNPKLKIDNQILQNSSYDKGVLLSNHLEKSFLENIEEISKKNNYIVIDLLDERYDLLEFNDSIIMDSWVLKSTDLVKRFDFIRIKRNEIPVKDWEKACINFASILNKYFNKKVIIHEMYLSEIYLIDGKYCQYPKVEEIREVNEMLKHMYGYLKKQLNNPTVIKVEEYNYTDSALLNVFNPAKKNSEYNKTFIKELNYIYEKSYKNKVAVVIASYNVENYITESINSVLNQTLSQVELIVVDDGSNDRTQSIIKQLAKHEPRLKYKFIKNSGSPSLPRNIGKLLADAEYIMFLDGDDYLAPTACEKLYEEAKQTDADLIVGKMISFVGEKFFETFHNNPRFRKRIEYFKSLKARDITHITSNSVLYLFPSACAKLYRTELVENITFNERIKYAEDMLFSVETFFKSRKTVVIADNVYYYRGRTDNNISTTQMKSISNLKDLNQSIDEINRLIEDNRYNISNWKAFNNNIVHFRMLEASHHINTILDYKGNEQIEVLKIIKSSLFPSDFNKTRLKIFTLNNYIALSLMLDEKYEELLFYKNTYKELKMYDSVSEYPFSVNIINKDIMFEFDYKGRRISLKINSMLEGSKLLNRLLEISFNQNKLYIKGIAYFNGIPITAKEHVKHTILMKHRKSGEIYAIPARYEYNNKYSTSYVKYGHGGYVCEVEFDVDIKYGGYDFEIETEIMGIKKTTVLGGMNTNFIYSANNHFFSKNNKIYEVVPIVKNRSRLSINYKYIPNKVELFKRKTKSLIRQKEVAFKQIKNNSNLSLKKKIVLSLGNITEKMSSLVFRDKNIWLVSEKTGDSANDNGYWFFKHLREKHPELNVYYVINKKSNDYQKVKKLGKTINFFSLKHILYAMNAKLIFSTDNVNLVLPSNMKMLRKAKRVFLQHGVIHLKRVEHVYHSNRDLTDYIVASSELEATILEKHYGFNESEILNVGLPRFDSLVNKSTSDDKRILLTFTWRNTIKTPDDFVNSEYYLRMCSLLNNRKLQTILKKNHIKLDVCLHPNTSKILKQCDQNVLKSLSNSENIFLYDFNSVNVRGLIEKSMMIITDYSSILFDFVYLQKPVIGYSFENNLPIREEKLVENFPGYYVENEKAVIATLEKIINGKQTAINTQKYIKFTDGENCDRIVEQFKTHETIENNNSAYSMNSKEILE